MDSGSPTTDTLKALVYPGTTTPARKPPSLTDVLNSVGRALMSSELLYAVLHGVQLGAREIQNPILASAVLGVTHLILAVYMQWVGGPRHSGEGH